jgi:hypothetical protein
MLFKFGKQAKSGMSSAESEERLRLSALLGRLPPESGTFQRTVLSGYFAASASASCTEMSSPRRSITSAFRAISRPSETLYEEKNHTAAAASKSASAAMPHHMRFLEDLISYRSHGRSI